MKASFAVLLFSILYKQSAALTCNGCEVSSSSENCNFTYDCKSGDFCETLISKVNGHVSVILSCSSLEKCQTESTDMSLDDCEHSNSNTECYSCCKGDQCNTLKKALKKLPDDVFENEKDDILSTKKVDKLKIDLQSDDDDEDSRSGEVLDKKPAKKPVKKSKKLKVRSEEIDDVELETKDLEDEESAEKDELSNDEPSDGNNKHQLSMDEVSVKKDKKSDNKEQLKKEQKILTKLEKMIEVDLENMENNKTIDSDYVGKPDVKTDFKEVLIDDISLIQNVSDLVNSTAEEKTFKTTTVSTTLAVETNSPVLIDDFTISDEMVEESTEAAVPLNDTADEHYEGKIDEENMGDIPAEGFSQMESKSPTIGLHITFSAISFALVVIQILRV